MRIRGDEFFEQSKEGERSPDQQWAVDGSSVHRVLWLPARDDDALPVGDDERHFSAQSILGFNTLHEEDILCTVGNAPGKRRWIERQLPHAYPATVDPNTNPGGRPCLFAQSIGKCEAVTGHAMGVGGSSADGGPRSRHGARYYTTYRSLPYDLREDEDVLAGTTPSLLGANGGGGYTDETGGALPARPDEGSRLETGWVNTRYIIKNEEDVSAQLTMPQGVLKFDVQVAGVNDVVLSGFPFTNTKVRVYYEWCLVPVAAIPRVAIADCLNCVNIRTFDGYEAGTLLFTGYRIVLRRGPFGDFLAQVLYSMIYRPNFDFVSRTVQGWNAFPRARAGDMRYDKVSSDGSGFFGKTPYPEKHFYKLFAPDQDYP